MCDIMNLFKLCKMVWKQTQYDLIISHEKSHSSVCDYYGIENEIDYEEQDDYQILGYTTIKQPITLEQDFWITFAGCIHGLCLLYWSVDHLFSNIFYARSKTKDGQILWCDPIMSIKTLLEIVHYKIKNNKYVQIIINSKNLRELL